MEGSTQADLSTTVSQLNHVVNCSECGDKIDETTANGDWETGYVCNDCDESGDDALEAMKEVARDESEN